MGGLFIATGFQGGLKMVVPDVLMQLAQALDLIALKYGALGISLAMFAESAGIPFASALVILTAGKMIATGKVSFIVAVIASSIGITAGSFLSYLIGAMGHRIGRVINTGLSSKRIKKIPIQETKFKKFYDKYGKYSILMGQLFGTTRTFISFPAGVMHMNIFLFLLYTALGGFLFSIAAIGSSMVLNQIMKLLVFITHELLQLPVWVWPVFFVFLISLYFVYRHNRKLVHGKKQ